MKAMVLAVAASVGESAFARWWWKAGDVLDVVIPVTLLVAIVAALSAIFFGLAQ